MKSKRNTGRRNLIAETLESRELLAANAFGRTTVPSVTFPVNNVPAIHSLSQSSSATEATYVQLNSTSGVAAQPEMNSGVTSNSESSLSQREIDELLFMREEEKLARDVYLALSESSSSQIFSNIAQSEQQHMDAVATLIAKYGLDDPINDDTPGVFTNETLQRLYDDLVSDRSVNLDYLGIDLVIEGGATSLLAALKVGVLIEELDISDLQNAIEQ